MNRVEKLFHLFIEEAIKIIKGDKHINFQRPSPPPRQPQQQQQQQELQQEKEKKRCQKELKTAFLLLDKNQDGKISVSEFQHMLKHMGIIIPDKLILTLIKSASATGECILTEKEFLDWISSFLSETPEDITQDLIAAFAVFDKDNNGYITKDELKSAMDLIGEAVSEQEIDSMIQLADLDKNGKIDYNEFAKLLL